MTKLSLLIIAIVPLGNSKIIFPKDTIINMDIEIAVLIILSVSFLSLENDFCNAKVMAEDDNANIGSATAPIMVSNKLYVAILNEKDGVYSLENITDSDEWTSVKDAMRKIAKDGQQVLNDKED